MKKIVTLFIICFTLFIKSYAQNPIVGDLEVTGNISTSGLIKLGHSIRSPYRAELHLHAIGENSVSEIFFGSNSRDDANVRWTLSDRGESEGKFYLYEGPALNGSFAPRITVIKGGNVGIGSTTPTEKLTIGQGGNLLFEGTGTGLILLGHSIRATDRAELHLHANGENSVSEIFFGSNSRDDSNVRWTLSDRGESEGKFHLYEGPALNGGFAPRITVVKGGNVGIGTSDPKAKLSVNGTIITKEIKVLADISQYPDFVFSNSYNLRSLEEVERYVKENNHLPDIPKAEEVKEGIALGEMNTKLLQKIEELTLYMIEMNKRVNSLETENYELKEEIKEIKSVQ